MREGLSVSVGRVSALVREGHTTQLSRTRERQSRAPMQTSARVVRLHRGASTLCRGARRASGSPAGSREYCRASAKATVELCVRHDEVLRDEHLCASLVAQN